MLDENDFKKLDETERLLGGDKDFTDKAKILDQIFDLINSNKFQEALNKIEEIYEDHRLWFYDYPFGDSLISAKALCICCLNGMENPDAEQIIEQIKKEENITNYLKSKAIEYMNNEFKIMMEALKKHAEETEV